MLRNSWKSRRVVGLGLTSALIAALVGCSTSSDSSSSPDVANEKTTLKFVTYTGGDAGVKYENVIKAFEAANDGITVEMEVIPGDDTYNNVITSRIEGGESPDLFEILNSLPGEKPYVDAGLLLDLSDRPWVDDQLPVVAEAADFFDGKTYQFISQLDATGVFYNKDMFDKYGVTVPTTWNEFLDAINTFKGAGVVPLGTGAKDGWPLVVQALAMAASLPEFAPGGQDAADLVAGDATFTASDGWRTTVDDFAALVKSGAYDPDASGVTWPASAEDFAAGKSAMFIQGTFAIPSIRAANADLNMGLFPLPYVPTGEPPVVSVSYGGILAVPAEATNVGAAKKFLDFLAQDDILATYLTDARAFSPMNGVVPELDPAAQEIVDALAAKSSEFALASGLVPATQGALQSGLQAIIAGSGTVDETLAGMDRAQTGS